MKKTFFTAMLIVVGFTNVFTQNVKPTDVSSKCNGCTMRFVNFYPDVFRQFQTYE